MAEHAVYLRWAELDPEAAVRFATSIGNAGPAWAAWAQTDPDKALASAAAAPGSEALVDVLQTIAEADPERAVRLGDTYHTAFQDRSVQVTLAEMEFDGDPRGAVERACSVSGNGAETPLLEKWAKADPDAALAWAKAQANQEVKSATTYFVFRQWADSSRKSCWPPSRPSGWPGARHGDVRLRLQPSRKGPAGSHRLCRWRPRSTASS